MSKKNKVYVVHVTTESADHYLYAFKKKPSEKDICKKVAEYEGLEDEEDLDYLENQLLIQIEECEIE